MSNSNDQLYGQNDAFAGQAQHNSDAFQIAQALRAVSTATICKVVKCTVAGVVGPIGQVDVLPLVDLVDGIGQTSQHVNILSLPYMRMQGGTKCIIMDPIAGDLGLVVFADRDTSAVRKAKKQSPPGSRRRFNMADGMYVGTVLSPGQNPDVYIRFHDDGTIIVANAKGSSSKPFEAVIGSTWSQIKQKGQSDMHLTIDGASGTIIVGKPTVIGPDPYPNY